MERHVQDKLNNACASGSRLCVAHFIDSVCVKKTSSLVVNEKKKYCNGVKKLIKPSRLTGCRILKGLRTRHLKPM